MAGSFSWLGLFARRWVKIRFDRIRDGQYVRRVQRGNVSTLESPRLRIAFHMPLPPALTHAIGRRLIRFLLTVQGLGAFALITLVVILQKFRVARQVVWPATIQEIS